MQSSWFFWKLKVSGKERGRGNFLPNSPQLSLSFSLLLHPLGLQSSEIHSHFSLSELLHLSSWYAYWILINTQPPFTFSGKSSIGGFFLLLFWWIEVWFSFRGQVFFMCGMCVFQEFSGILITGVPRHAIPWIRRGKKRGLTKCLYNHLFIFSILVNDVGKKLLCCC